MVELGAELLSSEVEKNVQMQALAKLKAKITKVILTFIIFFSSRTIAFLSFEFWKNFKSSVNAL